MAISLSVVVVGGALFHDNGEAAMQMVGLVGVIVMLGTMIALFLRDERRERREGKEPQ